MKIDLEALTKHIHMLIKDAGACDNTEICIGEGEEGWDEKWELHLSITTDPGDFFLEGASHYNVLSSE